MPGRTGVRWCAAQPINYQWTFFMSCVVYSSAPFMHCVYHYSAEGFAL